MTQYDFDKLLEKYLQGDCTPEEELLLDEWSCRQLNHVATPLLDDEVEATKKQIWKRLQKSTLSTTPLSIKWLSWTRLGMVASFALIISVSALWYAGFFQPKFNIQNTELIDGVQKGLEVTNTTANPQVIPLQDGSTVTLQPNSTITFPEKFGEKNRIVYLKGEGFFSVKRDTTKPFYVYAGNLVTEVLGTSFIVKSYQNDPESEVVVVSGKVKVYHTEKGVSKFATILTPNQKVVFNKHQQILIPQVVEKPLVLVPPSSPIVFIFHETPLSEVLQKMERTYGLNIELNPNLYNCTFSGDLNGLELDMQLDMICKSISAEYEKRETHFIINGRGCH